MALIRSRALLAATCSAVLFTLSACGGWSSQAQETQTGAAAPSTAAGKLERVKVHGKSLEGNLMGESAEPDVSIYLPASYATDPDRRYPVVYLLHGYTGTDLSYFGPGGRQLDQIAERVFANGSAQEMILVMPNCMNVYGGCMYSNSVTAGDWETYVADDLVSYIDKNYRTIATRESRGLAGHSMGGYGTIRIGMKRPDVFNALYALSSCCLNEGTIRPPAGGVTPLAESIRSPEEAQGNRDVMGTLARAAAWAPNPTNPPFFFDLPTKNGEVQPDVEEKWAANSPVAMLDQYVGNLKKYKAIALDIGLQDSLLASDEVFVDRLKRFDVPHTFETYEGDHNSGVPQRLEEKVLPFFSEQLEFSP
jgi:S-formylglutathione hydrolase